MEKNFLEYRLNGFLVSFQVWIYETISAIARKNYCMKHESQRPRMLSWSSNQHVTSVRLRKTIFDLIKLDVNQIVPLEAEKREEYVVDLFVEGLGGDQDDDNFEHPIVGLKKFIDEGKTKSVDRIERSTEKKNKGKINEQVQQSNEKVLRRLSEVALKFVQSNDVILKRISDPERRMQSNSIVNRLRDVEERIKTNEEVMERLQILECKVEKMLAGNEGQMNDGVESLPNETNQMLAGNKEEMKDGVERLPDETDKMLAGNEEQTKDDVESLPDETDQVYNDFPSFSLGIEFELNCGENDVEVPVRKSEKSVEKSDKAVEKSLRAVVKSDKAVEMNLNEEIEFHEDDWLKVNDIVARSLAKNQEDIVSPCNEGRIDFLEEVELKDDVWEKVVEVTAAIEVETEIEEGNARIIDIDDETPDMHLKRQKKPGVLLQSPWVNEFDSTSGTKKRVVKGNSQRCLATIETALKGSSLMQVYDTDESNAVGKVAMDCGKWFVCGMAWVNLVVDILGIFIIKYVVQWLMAVVVVVTGVYVWDGVRDAI
ncbi:Hypothetical predicted protein [Olea europaea subsp. europaea]|uniref:Uncharacterized protein n=1 Tax=Olea europaea subsp. europaea TaxID=158383 RepID=A0A8S0TVV9_OLEEU|nr:Hypothetical predicted protein [Olea europaea subsp. europaea]